jgi:hypothetical protein
MPEFSRLADTSRPSLAVRADPGVHAAPHCFSRQPFRSAPKEQSADQSVWPSMTIIGSRFCVFVAGMTLVAGSAFAEALSPAPAPTAPAVSTAPGQNLSEKLNRSNGVIRPKEVDPAIEKPRPTQGIQT